MLRRVYPGGEPSQPAGPGLVFALVDREKLTALVAEKYQKYHFFPWLVRTVDGI